MEALAPLSAVQNPLLEVAARPRRLNVMRYTFGAPAGQVASPARARALRKVGIGLAVVAGAAGVWLLARR